MDPPDIAPNVNGDILDDDALSDVLQQDLDQNSDDDPAAPVTQDWVMCSWLRSDEPDSALDTMNKRMRGMGRWIYHQKYHSRKTGKKWTEYRCCMKVRLGCPARVKLFEIPEGEGSLVTYELMRKQNHDHNYLNDTGRGLSLAAREFLRPHISVGNSTPTDLVRLMRASGMPEQLIPTNTVRRKAYAKFGFLRVLIT